MSTKRQEQIRCKKEGKDFNEESFNRIGKVNAKHYVKNADLYEEYCKCLETGELSNELVNMFINIATKLSQTLYYNDPTDRDDCIAQALMDLTLYWKDFNPEISTNPFAWCTSVCRNAYAKAWRKLGKMKFPDSIMVSLSDNIYTL